MNRASTHTTARNQPMPHNHAADATPGTCLTTDGSTASTSYSDADLAGLLYMIEEEKLAGDLYDALFEQTGLRVFDRIGDAEDQHQATLVAQAQSLGLNLDEVLSLPEGVFANPELQALYDSLLSSASVSTRAALEVGVLVENADIADLQTAGVSLVGTPLGDAYDNLLAGSVRHLAAFEGLLG